MYLFIFRIPSRASSRGKRSFAVAFSCNTFLSVRSSDSWSVLPNAPGAPRQAAYVNGVQAASVVLLAIRFARSWTVLDGSPVGAEFSMLVDHASLASKRAMKPGKHGRKKISAGCV